MGSGTMSLLALPKSQNDGENINFWINLGYGGSQDSMTKDLYKRGLGELLQKRARIMGYVSSKQESVFGWRVTSIIFQFLSTHYTFWLHLVSVSVISFQAHFSMNAKRVFCLSALAMFFILCSLKRFFCLPLNCTKTLMKAFQNTFGLGCGLQSYLLKEIWILSLRFLFSLVLSLSLRVGVYFLA